MDSLQFGEEEKLIYMIWFKQFTAIHVLVFMCIHDTTQFINYFLFKVF